MRVWACACLLLYLPASASAAGLYSAPRPTLACEDDAALRTLSDHTQMATQSPAQRQTLIRQGNCHAVTPDIRWEKIANRNGLPLMRRVPPEPGLPPLYFMTDDIAPLPAPPASTQPHAAGHDADPVAAAAPPADQPVAPDAPAVIVQPMETPQPTDLFFMTRGFQKLGSLVLTLMLAGGAGWVLILILRAGRIMIQRRRAVRICMELAERHRPMLARWYMQARTTTTLPRSRTPWNTQVERFMRTTTIPALESQGLGPLWPAIRKRVHASITAMAAGAATNPPDRPAITPGTYHKGMNQAEYAAFCSHWIEKAGWETRPPVATGLGSDIHCSRNGLKMLVHCWIDHKPVHDDVIWQGIRGKVDGRTDIGIIVSNAPYTQEALALGKKHRVFLLHHEEVFRFVSGIEVPDVA
ncbi:restriction endonuclease [Komagataeibacter sp. SM21]|uniref:restriction endonuclease n=1 Tax=Komagataeibacter sp. SM21 TaxID=3242899 RepID=UPI003526F438